MYLLLFNAFFQFVQAILSINANAQLSSVSWAGSRIFTKYLITPAFANSSLCRMRLCARCPANSGHRGAHRVAPTAWRPPRGAHRVARHLPHSTREVPAVAGRPSPPGVSRCGINPGHRDRHPVAREIPRAGRRKRFARVLKSLPKVFRLGKVSFSIAITAGVKSERCVHTPFQIPATVCPHWCW
jgi:hypothetical protein